MTTPRSLGCGCLPAFVLGVAGILALTLMAIVGFGGSKEPEINPAGEFGYGGGLNTEKVPEEVVPWILKAAETCQPITAPIIAAQLWAESGLNPNTPESPVGAQGIAQFMPATWNEQGIDADGNGITSPYDLGDAIMTHSKYMCQIWKQVGSFPGNRLDLALAGYNAGPGAIAEYGGVPPYEETISYVKKINEAIPTFTAADTGTVIGSGDVAFPLPQGTYIDQHSYGATSAYWENYHTGEDYSASLGTPVYAAHDGVVVHDTSQASWAGPNFIMVESGPGRLTTWYAHMSTITVKDGAHVKAGDQIGTVGAEGNVSSPTAYHLHFEVHPTGGGYLEDDTDPDQWFQQYGINP